MNKQFHFISGLPRSGSTLLAAVLRQNPHFHAGMTSPVGSLYNRMVASFSAGSEHASMVSDRQRRDLLHGLFENYYKSIAADRQLIFDTNRLWCSKLPGLRDLFPNAKVIACVRNVAWIMDSLERKYRENPYENTRLFNDDSERNTVVSRVETLAQRNRLVGFAWSALKEAFYSEEAEAMLIVDYDLLCQAPERVMRLIYQFIDEPYFEHDFENISYDVPDFDAGLGMRGLHKVAPKVAYRPRQSILPPDLFEQYVGLSFWKDQRASRANVITVKQETEKQDFSQVVSGLVEIS